MNEWIDLKKKKKKAVANSKALNSVFKQLRFGADFNFPLIFAMRCREILLHL